MAAPLAGHSLAAAWPQPGRASAQPPFAGRWQAYSGGMNFRTLARPVFLTLMLFFAQPLAFGGWLSFIPQVQAKLGLSKSELALALLGMPIAVVSVLQLAGRLMSWLGPRRLLMIGFPLNCAAVLLPLFAVGQWGLFASLLLVGATLALTQIGLNVYAGRLEKATGKVVMNTCHGFWALGLMAGSLAAGMARGWSPVAVVGVMALVAAIAGVALARAVPHFGAPPGQDAPPRRRLRQLPRRLVLISAVVFFVAMTEGAMSDWAAVYLAERLESVSGQAGFAVSLYAGFLALGRLLGDPLRRRIGPYRLLVLAPGLALAGLTLLVLPLPLAIAVPGFALVGLGVSVGFPMGVSAVSALDDTYESSNVAIMSAVAVAAFLVGPPMIGFIAEATSLRIGFATLVPGMIFGIYGAKFFFGRNT